MLVKIINSYINNLPNIKDMHNKVIGLGWTVEYEYTFLGRWLRWICFYDCTYVLNRKRDDMRNYTS